jgi:FtsZ-binding cell division protein ZapB
MAILQSSAGSIIRALLRASLPCFSALPILAQYTTQLRSHGAGNTIMSKLDSAMSRFASALDKLEAGVNRQLVRAQSAKGLQGEVERLKEDRAELAEELDQLKSDARRLNELNERASETLADAIEGIREVLAEG